MKHPSSNEQHGGTVRADAPRSPSSAPVLTVTVPDIVSLQAVTEEAVGHREMHAALSDELFSPAVLLAQQLAAQLDAYGYTGKELTVEQESGAPHVYMVLTACWKTGRTGSRTKHSMPVLLIKYGQLAGGMLFDPTRPDRNWLSDKRARTPQVGLPGQRFDLFLSYEMASADDLACFASDALKIVSSVRDKELARRSLLEQGIQQAESSLAAI